MITSPAVTGGARSAAATRIETAAIGLFYEHGFRSTSVRDIMSACNLTPPAFYNHFASKDALLYSIANGTHDLCDGFLFRGLSMDSTPRGQLWNLTHAIALFHAVHAKRAHVTSEDFRALPPRELDDIRARRRQNLSMFEHVITSGVGSGDFARPRLGRDRSARLMATTITNMTIRIAEWFSPDYGLTADEVAAFHADLALRMTSDNGEAEFSSPGESA